MTKEKNQPMIKQLLAAAAAVLALWWHSTPGVSGLGGWLTGRPRSGG